MIYQIVKTCGIDENECCALIGSPASVFPIAVPRILCYSAILQLFRMEQVRGMIHRSSKYLHLEVVGACLCLQLAGMEEPKKHLRPVNENRSDRY